MVTTHRGVEARRNNYVEMLQVVYTHLLEETEGSVHPRPQVTSNQPGIAISDVSTIQESALKLPLVHRSCDFWLIITFAISPLMNH